MLVFNSWADNKLHIFISLKSSPSIQQTLKTINAGVGIKLTYSSGMAFRMEINYRNLTGSNTYSYSYESSSGSDTYETTTSVISISFGASILL